MHNKTVQIINFNFFSKQKGLKLKADYYYFKLDYAKSLQFYQNSLGTYTYTCLKLIFFQNFLCCEQKKRFILQVSFAEQ